MEKITLQYKVIEKIQRFYTDEIYYRVHTCKTWEEVCKIVDPFYDVFGEELKPIKHYTNPYYGEVWDFKGREVGFSAAPDYRSCTVFVDNAGIW